MFGIPEKHMSQLVKSNKYPDGLLSLIEETGELSTALAKHQQEHYDSWEASRNHIIEEMAHVLISMNLLAGTLSIDECDICKEVFRKGLLAGFDVEGYLDSVYTDPNPVVRATFRGCKVESKT